MKLRQVLMSRKADSYNEYGTWNYMQDVAWIEEKFAKLQKKVLW